MSASGERTPERYVLLGYAPFEGSLTFDDPVSVHPGDLPEEIEFEICVLSRGEVVNPDVGFLPTCRATPDGGWVIRANDCATDATDLPVTSDELMADEMEAAVRRHPLMTMVNRVVDEGYGPFESLHTITYDIELDGAISLSEAVDVAAELREALVCEAERNAMSVTRRLFDEWMRRGNDLELRRLIDLVETSSSANEKGKVLEELVAKLLTQVEGFTVTSRVRTTTEEIDIEIVNTSEAASWRRSRDVVLVECKNLAGPIGKDAVVLLRDKVRHRRGRCDVGVLVSWNGFAKTVTQHELRDSSGDVTILLIDGASLRRAVVDGMEAVLHDAFLDAVRR